mgnify:CR=1 FL=1
MTKADAMDSVLFPVEDMEEMVVTPVQVSQNPRLAKVNYCQQQQMVLCGAISRDLVLGREPLSDTPQEDIDEIHGVAVDTFREVTEDCREFCVAGISGVCIIARAKSLTREQIVEVHAGDYRTSTYVGQQTYTTPILQTTNSILGRAVLPEGNPIVNMSAGRTQAYADHLASTELGREVGLPERIALAI